MSNTDGAAPETFGAGLMPVWLATQLHEDDGLETPIDGDKTLLADVFARTIGTTHRARVTTRRAFFRILRRRARGAF